MNGVVMRSLVEGNLTSARVLCYIALLQPETGWTAVCKDSREPFRPITIFRRNRKPKIFRFENVMETEIKKFLTFVNLSKK